MECGVGDFACVARSYWDLVQPHMQWIGYVLGAAMTFWKWWDGREAVVYRRTNRRLEERGYQVIAACEHTLGLILRPSPGAMPRQPQFITPALREVFAQSAWHTPFTFFNRLNSANAKLGEAHSALAEKYTTLRRQKSFVVEQRYSAFVLEGAIAAARAKEAKREQDRDRLNNEALQRFEAALRVEGKASDLQALEIKGMQLIKLARKPEALQVFQQIEVLLAALLMGATPLDDAVRLKYQLQRIRNGRYLAEIHHHNGANGVANGILLALVNGQAHLHTQRLEGRDLLERAHFHEVHSCVRVRLAIAAGAQNPATGVAGGSIGIARSDYNDLISQLNPQDRPWIIRAWRWLRQSDRADGTAELRKLAAEGLRRLAEIGKCNGCEICAPVTAELGAKLQARYEPHPGTKPVTSTCSDYCVEKTAHQCILRERAVAAIEGTANNRLMFCQ